MRTRKLAQYVAIPLLLIGLAALGAAQPRGWELLGEAHVDGAVDHDRIRVTGAKGEFRAIRLRVENGPIDFDRVEIHFHNGRVAPVRLRYQIRSGGSSRVIDLPGGERIIENVEFWYRPARWGTRPKVLLWGRH